MRLIVLSFASALALAAAPAFAAEGGTDELAALDLALPQAATVRNDPPGTWYGDTSGVPATGQATATSLRRACPTSADGSPSDITGSVGAGVGYSSRLGNSNWQAATLNYCKSYFDEDGDERTVNVQLNVGSYDGPDAGPRMGPMPGPRPWGRGPR